MIILVIDANILFSALIRNSVTAKLLFEGGIMLYTSEFVIEAFEILKERIEIFLCCKLSSK